MTRFRLPAEVMPLVEARNALKRRYAAVDLRFTFDGNLVGDLGEAVAAELYGLQLTARNNEGVDGIAVDGRSVQVKASGTKGDPAFRAVDVSADHLIVMHLDYDQCIGEVIYNGPEEPVRRVLPSHWVGQRRVSVSMLKRLNLLVEEADRLPMVTAER